MAGHAQLKFVMTECSKTQIRLTQLRSMVYVSYHCRNGMTSYCVDNTTEWFRFWWFNDLKEVIYGRNLSVLVAMVTELCTHFILHWSETHTILCNGMKCIPVLILKSQRHEFSQTNNFSQINKFFVIGVLHYSIYWSRMYVARTQNKTKTANPNHFGTKLFFSF